MGSLSDFRHGFDENKEETAPSLVPELIHNPITAQTMDGSDDVIRSPSPSGSIISFRSANAEGLVRSLGGRLFSNQNETYMLLLDDEEHEQMEYQHRVLTLTLDSLYAAPDLVRAAMTPSQKCTPAAVDIGTGSGQWAIEFAREFPHASVVGIDLVPPSTKSYHRSSQLQVSLEEFSETFDRSRSRRFEVDDANLSLTHYAKSFNVCHIRNIWSGVHDFENFLNRVAQILRTNGVLLLVAGDGQLFTENRTPVPIDVEEGQPGWCATQALFWAMHMTTLAMGDSAHDKHRWEEWLLRSPYYTSIGVEDVFIPIGPWMNNLDNRCTYITQLMQVNSKGLISAFRPILRANGYEESLMERWIKTAEDEISEMKPKLFARWRFGWAVRNSTKWVDELAPEMGTEG